MANLSVVREMQVRTSKSSHWVSRNQSSSKPKREETGTRSVHGLSVEGLSAQQLCRVICPYGKQELQDCAAFFERSTNWKQPEGSSGWEYIHGRCSLKGSSRNERSLCSHSLSPVLRENCSSPRMSIHVNW